MRAKVLVAGGVSFDLNIAVDRFPEPRAQTVFARGSRETVGSTGAGKALNLALLGIDTTLYALVGDDGPGRAATALLTSAGVRCELDVDPRGTERHVNLMADDGGRISIYASYATAEPPPTLARIDPLLAAADVVVVNIIDAVRPLLARAAAAHRPVWTDLHDWDGEQAHHQQFAEAASHVFLSSDRLADHRALMVRLLDAGKAVVVCTHGRQGATALTRDGWLHLPIIDSYPRVDTNGAGDAFFAGFLFGALTGHDVRRCLELATVVGGLAVTSPELAKMDMTAALVESEHRRHFP